MPSLTSPIPACGRSSAGRQAGTQAPAGRRPAPSSGFHAAAGRFGSCLVNIAILQSMRPKWVYIHGRCTGAWDAAPGRRLRYGGAAAACIQLPGGSFGCALPPPLTSRADAFEPVALSGTFLHLSLACAWQSSVCRLATGVPRWRCLGGVPESRQRQRHIPWQAAHVAVAGATLPPLPPRPLRAPAGSGARRPHQCASRITVPSEMVCKAR